MPIGRSGDDQAFACLMSPETVLAFPSTAPHLMSPEVVLTSPPTFPHSMSPDMVETGLHAAAGARDAHGLTLINTEGFDTAFHRNGNDLLVNKNILAIDDYLSVVDGDAASLIGDAVDGYLCHANNLFEGAPHFSEDRCPTSFVSDRFQTYTRTHSSHPEEASGSTSVQKPFCRKKRTHPP